MVFIEVRDGDSFERSLRRFNKEVLREGIIPELRNRQYFEKPSEIKKKKLQERARKFRYYQT